METTERAPRVLLAEDDADLRDLIALRLSRNGHIVHEVTTGLELLRAVASIETDAYPLDAVDLIILDQRMPEMLGLDAIRMLRAARFDVPVLLITAFPSADVRARAEALHAHVLAKPFQLERLSLEIERSLADR